MKKVAVIGAGPAGSTLARLLAKEHIYVDLYQENGKPRGYCAGGLGFYAIDKLCQMDSVVCSAIKDSTLETVQNVLIALSLRGQVLDQIYVNAKELYRNSLGVVMDREKFDKLLMDKAVNAGAFLIDKRAEPRELLKQYDFVVDARGFSAWKPCRGSEYTVQWWIKRRTYGPTMVLHFDYVLKSGYYWYFPAGPTGAKYGFGESLKEYPKKKRLILETGAKLWRIKPWEYEGKTYAAVLPLCGKVRLYEEGVFYVGTAAGFIDPATGAGIRYAIESAHALADAIKNSRSKTVARVRYYINTVKLRTEIKTLWRIRKHIIEKDMARLFTWAKKLDVSKIRNPYDLAKEALKLIV